MFTTFLLDVASCRPAPKSALGLHHAARISAQRRTSGIC